MGDNEEGGVLNQLMEARRGKRSCTLIQDTGCADLLMDPRNPSVLYASMWEFRRTGWSFDSGGENSALYKSIDGGKTWDKIHEGFPEGKLDRDRLP